MGKHPTQTVEPRRMFGHLRGRPTGRDTREIQGQIKGLLENCKPKLTALERSWLLRMQREKNYTEREAELVMELFCTVPLLDRSWTLGLMLYRGQLKFPSPTPT